MPIQDFYAAVEGGRRGQQQILDNEYRQRQEQRVNRLDAERSSNAALENVMAVLKLKATPVNADRTIQQMLGQGEQQQAANAGVIGLTDIQRQADPSRTVPIVMPGGGQQQYELPNADQMFQRLMNEKLQLHRGELENFSQRQQVDDASALDRQKQFFAYQQQMRQQLAAQQPTFDPANPMGAKVPMDNLNGWSRAMELFFPEYKPLNNYGTNDTTMARVNRVTGNLDTKVIKDAVGGRPRQGTGSSGPKPGDSAKFNKIESLKRIALKNAEEDFKASGDADKLNAAKLKAQRDYETAIVRAGGSVAPQGAAGPAASAIREGTVIKNPKTGERLVMRSGQWAPM